MKKIFAFRLSIAWLLIVAIGALPATAAPEPTATATAQSALDSALFAAINRNDVKRARSLLQRGASVNARDSSGRTALILVSFIGGPEDETTGVSSTDLLKLFLNYRPNVNLTDAEGNTALMEAASSSLVATRLLLGHGARVNVQNKWGDTPLMRAVAAPCEGMCSIPKCAEILLNHGANANTANRDGETALTLAAQLSLYDPAAALLDAKMLLAHGADAGARTANGNTALKWAKAGGNPAFIRLIQNALKKNSRKKQPIKNARDG